jgi:cell division protein FtsB
MKTLVISLFALFLLLQYKLWLEDGGIANIVHLQKAIAIQEQQNNMLKKQNTALAAEVLDLKHGQAAIEEHARNEMGMVKKGETFYQIID